MYKVPLPESRVISQTFMNVRKCHYCYCNLQSMNSHHKLNSQFLKVDFHSRLQMVSFLKPHENYLPIGQNVEPITECVRKNSLIQVFDALLSDLFYDWLNK